MAKRGRPPGSGRGSAGVVGHLKAAHADLLSQKRAIDQRVAALESAIAAFGSAAPSGAAPAGGRGAASRGRPGPGARRGYRSGSLKEYIHGVLSHARGAVMSVSDVTSAVVRAGLKTKNKTLAKSVGVSLTEMPDVEKVGRGRFRLR